MRALALTVLAPLLAMTACSQIAEPRVRSALRDAGLSDRNADCMAGRMVDRLTVPQLRKLEALSGQNSGTFSQLSLADYLTLVQRVGDAEVVAVTTSSAALCATGLAS